MALTPEQNRDEIIAMALVAGMSANIGYTEASGEHFPAVAALKTSVPVQWLERFAALVAAKEREACAQVCEGMKSVPPKGGPEDVERGFNAGLARASRAIQSRSANVA